jgi:hypothetical protein
VEASSDHLSTDDDDTHGDPAAAAAPSMAPKSAAAVKREVLSFRGAADMPVDSAAPGASLLQRAMLSDGMVYHELQ